LEFDQILQAEMTAQNNPWDNYLDFYPGRLAGGKKSLRPHPWPPAAGMPGLFWIMSGIWA
jgi:hypothetical protein